MGVDNREVLKERLTDEYQQEYSKTCSPRWAFEDIAPAIPYVGEEYHDAPAKVFIYASAENLAGDLHHLQELRARSVRQQMHRSYGLRPRERQDQNVHIEPINNGALLKVARHILSFYPFGAEFSSSSSKAFLEQVSVANPGKFSIDPRKLDRKPRKNLDYADDPGKFAVQRSYVETDFKHLAPQIVILPRKVFDSLQSAGLDPLFQKQDHIILIQQVQFQAIYGKGKRRQPTAPRPDWNTSTDYGAWRSPWYASAYMQWITENSDRINWAEQTIVL